MFRLPLILGFVLFLATAWAVIYVAGELLNRKKPEEPSEATFHTFMSANPYTTETHPGPFWKCEDPRCFGPNRERNSPTENDGSTDGDPPRDA